MFRTVGDRPPLWESLLPAVLRLPDQLARVGFTGRPGVLRPVRAVLPPGDRPAVDAGGVLPAADVLEVPVPAGL